MYRARSITNLTQNSQKKNDDGDNLRKNEDPVQTRLIPIGQSPRLA